MITASLKMATAGLLASLFAFSANANQDVQLIPADELTTQLFNEGFDESMVPSEADELALESEMIAQPKFQLTRDVVRGVDDFVYGDPYYSERIEDGYYRDPNSRRRTQYTCWARDARGRQYAATGYWPDRVQRRALDRCERSARWCSTLGCR